MRYVLVRKYNRFNSYLWYNFDLQRWFQYHHVFFNSLVVRGKKLYAFNMFIQIKYLLKVRELYDPSLIILVALMKATPVIRLFMKRLGSRYQGIPVPITMKKRVAFGVRWILKSLRDQHRDVSVKLVVDLLILSIYNKGMAIEKKRKLYHMGSENRHLLKFYK